MILHGRDKRALFLSDKGVFKYALLALGLAIKTENFSELCCSLQLLLFNHPSFVSPSIFSCRPAFGLKTLLAYRYYFCPFPPSLVFPRINLLHIHVHLGVYKRTWTSMCNPCLPPKFWKIVSHSLTLQNQQKLILSPQRFKKQTYFYQLVPSRLF